MSFSMFILHSGRFYGSNIRATCFSKMILLRLSAPKISFGLIETLNETSPGNSWCVPPSHFSQSPATETFCSPFVIVAFSIPLSPWLPGHYAFGYFPWASFLHVHLKCRNSTASLLFTYCPQVVPVSHCPQRAKPYQSFSPFSSCPSETLSLRAKFSTLSL